MNVIEIKNLTKDYGDNRGIFDINLDIKQGEMVVVDGLTKVQAGAPCDPTVVSSGTVDSSAQG